MTKKLKKSELIEELAKKTGLTRTDAQRAIEGLSDVVHQQVAAGNVVPLPGIGKIQAVTRKARQVRNPQTGEVMEKGEHMAPRFTIAKPLKEHLAAGA